MNGPEFIVFRTFLNHFDADIAKMALEAAGIESFIRSDDCGGMRPHLWMGGIELVLHVDDAERAEEVLGNEATSPNGSTIWQAPTPPDPD
jgi:Putative prokaryotic signal transducing protein